MIPGPSELIMGAWGLFRLIKPITICTKGANFLVVLTIIFEVPSALDFNVQINKKVLLKQKQELIDILLN